MYTLHAHARDARVETTHKDRGETDREREKNVQNWFNDFGAHTRNTRDKTDRDLSAKPAIK